MSPEIVLAFAGLLALCVGAGVRGRASLMPYHCVQMGVVAALCLSAILFAQMPVTQNFETVARVFAIDRFSSILKIVTLVTVFFVFLYAREYNEARQIAAPEYYVLGLFSTVGMLVLISAASFLMLFLGVELISLPIYAMIALQRHSGRAIEAGMKYFIVGALASGMLLYGISFIFGATQSLLFMDVAHAVANMSVDNNPYLAFGLAFLVVGIAFKLGAAPFHVWVPDVFEGAPTSTTLLVSTAPKVAGLAMALRILAEALPTLSSEWQLMLVLVAVTSMILGNLAAIVQTNLKRMLAYSSIAHMGYMLLGLLCGTQRGYAAAVFYLLSYVLMTLGAFGLLTALSRAGLEVENIKDLAGLNSRHPWLAFLLLLLLFSFAGVPPLIGFIAKVGVLEALIDIHWVWLAVVALLCAIVGAYYYLNVVKVMYFERSEKEVVRFTYSSGLSVILSVNSLLVLVVGVFPGPLFALCRAILGTT
ncbi:MAG: NADH-quinone oxidoreductase subunit N [Gammaproteobacteria bacterium RIFCSPHIGHO2_12_FULL_45_9]|nr:MAG: NADH-quinone oxidoreductase subunit N [Gammaproteobacteria bacterium RIFCSPHIGHO2_12_FULL_45_9]